MTRCCHHGPRHGPCQTSWQTTCARPARRSWARSCWRPPDLTQHEMRAQGRCAWAPEAPLAQTALAPLLTPSVGVHAQMPSRPAQGTRHTCELETRGYNNCLFLPYMPTSYKKRRRLGKSVCWIALLTHRAFSQCPLLVGCNILYVNLQRFLYTLRGCAGLAPCQAPYQPGADHIGYEQELLCAVSSARSHPCAQTLASTIVQQPASRPQVWGAAAVVVAAVIVPCAQQCILAIPSCTLKSGACSPYKCSQVRLLSWQSCALRTAIHFHEHCSSRGTDTGVA